MLDKIGNSTTMFEEEKDSNPDKILTLTPVLLFHAKRNNIFYINIIFFCVKNRILKFLIFQ